MPESSHPVFVQAVRTDTVSGVVEEKLHGFRHATEAQRYEILRGLLAYLGNPSILLSFFDDAVLTRCLALFRKRLPPALYEAVTPLTLQRTNIRKMRRALNRLQAPAVPFERLVFDMTCIETGQRIRFPTTSLPEHVRYHLQVERERQMGLGWRGLLSYLGHLFEQAPDDPLLTSLRMTAEGVAWEGRKHERDAHWLWGLFLSNGRGKAEQLSVSVFEGGTGQVTLLATRIDASAEGEQFRLSIGHARWAATRYLQRLTAGYRENMSSYDMLLKIGVRYQPFGYQGASLGLPLAVMIVAHFLGVPLDHDVALTGELDAQGNVLGIIGISEKVRAAHACGVRRVFVPASNAAEGMKAAPDGIRIHGVRTLEETCDRLFRDVLIERGYRAFPLAAASLAAVSPPPPRIEEATRSTAPFVGRTEEVRRLRQGINRALSGRGNLTIIEGEAGIGKTRLLEQAQDYARQAGMQVFTGHCLSRQAPVPYMPFMDALTSLERDADSRGDGQAPPTDKTTPPAPGRVARLCRFMSHLKEEGTSLPPASIQFRLFEQIITVLRTLMKGPGLLFCIEDLHWADSGTLELVHYLARQVAGQRLYVLITYRTGEIPVEQTADDPVVETLRRLSEEGIGETFTLENMDTADIQELVGETLDDPTAPVWVRDRVYRESGGNPLFAKELLKYWQEAGTLTDPNPAWTAAPWADATVPPRIYDLISCRLKRLQVDERELLEAAAVGGGTRFDTDGLASVLDTRRIEALRRLHRLDRRQGIISASDGDVYQFAHEKIREVLYQELPEALRREYHAAWGRLLLVREEAGEETPVELLATHLYRGGDEARAIPYLCEAARRARKMCAFREARWYWEQAEGALSRQGEGDDEDTRIEVWLRLGWVCFELGEWDAAVVRYKAALKAAKRTGNQRAQAEALMQWGAIPLKQDKWDITRKLIKQSLEIYTACEYRKGIASALIFMGIISKSVGNTEKAKQYYHRALENAQLIHDEGLIAGTTCNLGIIACIEGEDELAIHLYKKSTKIHQCIGNIQGIAEVSVNIGLVYERQENWPDARHCYQKSIELYEHMGISQHRAIGNCYVSYGRVLARTNDLSLAEKMCRKGHHILMNLEDHRGIASAISAKGLIAYLKQDWEAATHCFDESERLYQEADDPYGYADTLRERAFMLSRRGELKQAIAVMCQAERKFQKIGAKGDVKIVRRELGKIKDREELGIKM